MKRDAESSSPADAAELGILDIGVLLLSIYVLVAMLIQTAVSLTPRINTLLDRIDFFVCLVFLGDFAVRYRRASSKLAFLKWGWIDLIGSIPAIDFLRWARLARVFRIIRILRAFRSARHLITYRRSLFVRIAAIP